LELLQKVAGVRFFLRHSVYSAIKSEDAEALTSHNSCRP